MRHSWRIVLSGVIGLLVLAGCGSVPPADGGMGGSQANAPAVVDAGSAVPTVESKASSDGSTTEDTASWNTEQRTAGDVTYSYKYPAGWTPELTYCVPGAGRNAIGNELPARCAATDILVGQKALDVGTLRGGNMTNLTIDNKQAMRQVDSKPRNGMASLIYTVMIYDATGAPLVGFSTSVGPGTDQATQNNITATLDKIAATLTAGR